MRIFVYRYMWTESKSSDGEKVFYRIISDCVEGQLAFLEHLIAQGVEKITYEYLSEFDCSLLGLCKPVDPLKVSLDIFVPKALDEVTENETL